jgi:hypothetical protein
MGRMEVQPHTFLISALAGGEWCMPLPLYRRESTSGALWIGGWLASRASLDVMAKRKIHASVGNRTSVVQSVA